MPSSLILFTDLVNGDAYATVAEIESLMIANKEWAALDQREENITPDPEEFAERDNLILAATNLFESYLDPGGDPLDENQPLLFPRDFGELDEIENLASRYNQDQQIRVFRLAVFYQIESYLRQTPAGKTDFKQRAPMPRPLASLAPRASNVLEFYQKDALGF